MKNTNTKKIGRGKRTDIPNMHITERGEKQHQKNSGSGEERTRLGIGGDRGGGRWKSKERGKGDIVGNAIGEGRGWGRGWQEREGKGEKGNGDAEEKKIMRWNKEKMEEGKEKKSYRGDIAWGLSERGNKRKIKKKNIWKWKKGSGKWKEILKNWYYGTGWARE